MADREIRSVSMRVCMYTIRIGVLKGYDALLNIVLDNTTEYLRDPDDPFKLTDETRQLGLAVCRGTAVVLVCPAEGMEPITNPFLQQE
ncbi:U6 snRNA-associated Sm-like protein LSm7 isoform X3 [Acropora palmata]|uniref:U6 snRNA-associated Sm-like protein LSm7 isoform X3 n=1 Tax=Acropora palmata TaxID=6131 RepID=UPI003DA1B2CF